MTTIPDPQIYRAAADIIRTNGLCKGWMVDGRVDPDPAKCPMSTDGSIRFVVSGRADATDAAAVEATDWFDEVMHKTVPGYFDKFGDYVGWNDDPARTAAGVVNALERAASAAEAARAAQNGGTA
jgi:hypothetical protein